MLNFNAEIYLTGVLESPCQHDYPGLRVMAVDNASTDGSADLLEDLISSNRIILALNAQNTGFGAGFNMGIRRLLDETDYLILTNPDLVLMNR